MKQGMKRKLDPKDKHTKASWKKRDEGRKGKQERYLVVADMIAGQAALDEPR